MENKVSTKYLNEIIQNIFQKAPKNVDRYRGIRQADGDNPITSRGPTIVRQTTENQHKLVSHFLKGCVCDIS